MPPRLSLRNYIYYIIKWNTHHRHHPQTSSAFYSSIFCALCLRDYDGWQLCASHPGQTTRPAPLEPIPTLSPKVYALDVSFAHTHTLYSTTHIVEITPPFTHLATTTHCVRLVRNVYTQRACARRHYTHTHTQSVVVDRGAARVVHYTTNGKQLQAQQGLNWVITWKRRAYINKRTYICKLLYCWMVRGVCVCVFVCQT